MPPIRSLLRIFRLAAALACAGLAAGCTPGAPPIHRVLLITVDTLRADRLGAYGSELGATPALDALAAQSVVFDTAYAAAPFTFPSLAALFTGRYPAELGIRSNRHAVPEGVPTLATVLRERGFRTAAVVSNFVLRHKAGLADGFDRYDDDMLQAEATRGWPERVGPDTTDAALAALEQLRDAPRWFLWVHYQDPHGPYTPPDALRERYLPVEQHAPDGDRRLPEDRLDAFGDGALPPYQVLDGHREVAFYRAGYDGEVAYVDAAIGRLLAAFDLSDDDLLVAFAADHGEALGEHGFWFGHGQQLTDDLVHVPLLLHVPGRTPSRRADVVSLADFFPTLLRAVLGEQAPGSYPGRDLLASGAESQASVPFLDTLNAYLRRRIGFVENGYKLILTQGDGVWDAELYRQGDETADLSAPAPQVVARMRDRLGALYQHYERGATERIQQFDEADEARLRALGYLGEEGE